MDLAERTGISRSTLSRIELGARGLRLEEAVRIAAVLDISVERLAPAPGLAARRPSRARAR